MNYYRRYVGDYMRKTSKLSLLEHGAYSILLDHYYAEEHPISLGLDEVYRMCRAITPEERRSVIKVLTRYFNKREDGYHNTRADEEIEIASKLIETAKENGRLGGRPRKTSDKPAGFPDASDGKPAGLSAGSEKGGISKPRNNHPPTTNLQPPSPNRQPPSKSPSAAEAAQAEFEAIWKAYPERTGHDPKQRALRAYHGRVAEGCTQAEMLDGVLRYAKFCNATGKLGSEYVMQCATFLGPEKPFRQPWTTANATADWRASPDTMLAKAKELGISTMGLSAQQLEREIATRLSR